MFGTYSLLLVGLSGLCFATALQQSVLALRLRDWREALYAVGIGCGGVITMITISYYHAMGIEEFTRAYQWHAVLSRPLFFAYALLMIEYARFKTPWVPAIYLGAETVKAILLFTHLDTPYFLRIDGIAHNWSQGWGEYLCAPIGQGTPLQPIQLWVPLIALAVSLEAARRTWRRGQRQEGVLVALAGSGGMLAVLADNLFNLWKHQEMHFVELALVAPCVLISWRASRRLIEAIEARQVLEGRLNSLVESRIEAQRLAALGTLAGGIAHDFNNILMAISSQLELLAPAHPDAEQEPALRAARAATVRGRDVIRRILAFAKQGPREAPRPVAVEGALSEACQLLRSLLPAHVGLEHGLAGQDTGLHALCDPVQLQQVLVNLGLNAGQAIGDKPGTVRFESRSLQHPGDEGLAAGFYAEISVIDDGPGMSESVRRRIFEPFFSTKGPQQGNGLGLAVVHGIVESFGGSVSCQSWPGRGTRFTVLLPGSLGPSALPEATKPAASGAAPALQGEILILDDEPDIAEALRRLLQRQGQKVHALNQPQAALDLLRAEPGRFSVLITDLNMPGLGGREVLAAARALDPRLQVILSTGSMSLDPVTEGFDAVLEKPFSLSQLRAVLDKLQAR